MDGTDRLVLLINRTVVKGGTRLHAYGFLAHRIYRAELSPLGFYSDWHACRSGPFSVDLARDLREAEKTGLVRNRLFESDSRELYSLGLRGLDRLSSLSRDHGDLARRMGETFADLNGKPLDALVEGICAGRPQYAVNGGIKDRATDGDRDEIAGFSEETERMLEELASGKADWGPQTPDEHIEYIKRLVGT